MFYQKHSIGKWTENRMANRKTKKKDKRTNNDLQNTSPKT